MSDECNPVPNFITGHVVGNDSVGICQDGARFLFSPTGTTFLLRVKATNDTAAQALDDAYQSGDEVVIAAYFCRGPENCVRYDCYAVWPAKDFVEKAKSLAA